MILSNLKSKVKSQAASKNLDLLNIQGMLIWLSLKVALETVKSLMDLDINPRSAIPVIIKSQEFPKKQFLKKIAKVLFAFVNFEMC